MMWLHVAEPVSSEIELVQCSININQKKERGQYLSVRGGSKCEVHMTARLRPAAERVHKAKVNLYEAPVVHETISKDQKMIQSCLPREGRFYEVYNRVTLRSEALRRAAGTLATPTKAEINCIKENRGDTLPKTVPYGPQRDQELRLRS